MYQFESFLVGFWVIFFFPGEKRKKSLINFHRIELLTEMIHQRFHWINVEFQCNPYVSRFLLQWNVLWRSQSLSWGQKFSQVQAQISAVICSRHFKAKCLVRSVSIFLEEFSSQKAGWRTSVQGTKNSTTVCRNWVDVCVCLGLSVLQGK